MTLTKITCDDNQHIYFRAFLVRGRENRGMAEVEAVRR